MTALSEIFDDILVEAIKKIIIPLNPRADKLCWVKDNKGEFSVESAYTFT